LLAEVLEASKMNWEGDPRNWARLFIFNDDDLASWFDLLGEPLEQPNLIAHEMQEVCHQQAIEWGQHQWPGNISLAWQNGCMGRLGADALVLGCDSTSIPIDGVNRPTWTDQLGQSPGEISCASTEIGPDTTRLWHALTDERDHFVVFHGYFASAIAWKSGYGLCGSQRRIEHIA
jgi:hypothetical protein